MLMDALISSCGTWRWWLTRQWDATLPRLVVCMLNPSDADASRNDPTILTLIKFAKRWGFGGLFVINQNAFRSPHPTVMLAQPVAVRLGPKNQSTWVDALMYARSAGGWVLAAWGNGGDNQGDFVHTAEMLGVPLKCMGVTQNGSPKHPLARGLHRIPDDQVPLTWPSGG